MKRIGFALGLFFSLLFAAEALADKNYGSFHVTVGEREVSVVSPSRPSKTVTVSVKNETFDKIISEIRTRSKTLKRFVLRPSGKKGDVFTLTVNIEKADGLYYVSVAPPFQEVPLTFSRESYEIP